MRNQPNARPFAVEPPVRRERHQPTAVWAADRAGPEVTVADAVSARARWVEWFEPCLARFDELSSQSLGTLQREAPNFAGNSTVALRMSHATGFRSLAIVSKPRRARLERYASAARSRIQDGRVAVPSRLGDMLSNQIAHRSSGCVERPTIAVGAFPSRIPVRVASAIRTLAATGSP